jgi:hypothetical protein
MGTWGPGVFDNDYALDLVSELRRGTDADPLVRVLREAANSDVSSPAAQEAVAAAALVLYGFGNDNDIAPEAVEWVTQHCACLGTQGSVYLALAALRRVLRPGSDLCASWIHEDVGEKYLAGVRGLVEGLEEAKSPGLVSA